MKQVIRKKITEAYKGILSKKQIEATVEWWYEFAQDLLQDQFEKGWQAGHKQTKEDYQDQKTKLLEEVEKDIEGFELTKFTSNGQAGQMEREIKYQVNSTIKSIVRHLKTKHKVKNKDKEVEVFGCELGMNHCVTGTGDCDNQSVVDGYCKFYKPLKVKNKDKRKEIPFIAVGNNELDEMEPIGETALCPNCKKKHKVEYGTDEDGNESKVLGFVNCGKKSYLVSVDGKKLDKKGER